jgi:predicted MFS family arabinose efflux permease
VLLVGAMFSMFFFLSQYLQGVRGYSPLHTGLAFLPMTIVMFSMVRTVPRLAERFGNTTLLTAGVSVALVGMTWLSKLSADTVYFPGIALPLVLLGVGMGSALAPLTAAGIARVAPRDAGAASGLVNVAQQLGGSLGVSVLVTVFAAADHPDGAGVVGQTARVDLANGVAASITGAALFMTLALTVIVMVVRRAAHNVGAPVVRTEMAR